MFKENAARVRPFPLPIAPPKFSSIIPVSIGSVGALVAMDARQLQPLEVDHAFVQWPLLDQFLHSTDSMPFLVIGSLFAEFEFLMSIRNIRRCPCVV